MEVAEISQLLNQTLSPDGSVVLAATESLDRLSLLPLFPLSLLSITIGGENHGQRIAAAAYLKNFTRRNIEDDCANSKVPKEFKGQLLWSLLQAEPSVLKVLVETFRLIVVAEFVKQNSWPELVPELRSAIENSNLVANGVSYEWNTVNTLSVLHALVRPFQYFFNPKIANEPVPHQLELIGREILAPLLVVFHNLVEEILSKHSKIEKETEKALLIICKCMYISVRSYMPSSLVPSLRSFCQSLISILDSLSLDHYIDTQDDYALRLKTGKRALLIFCGLVTRHRKYSDKLMPNIMNCVLKILRSCSYISRLDFLSERVISLAFDVVSHILETGPGWRMVSPHFSVLLESAIFPALVLNEKDISEWEDDAEEFIRKNLPAEVDEISGWREDLFTARKSAMNLLGVISISKGPPVGSCTSSPAPASKRKKGERNKRSNQRSSIGELLVLPFLSKFPVPSDAHAGQAKISENYFGVLMACGGLQDFLREQKPEYTATLLETRVLPLYSSPVCPPHLIAAASWVVGELVSCLPEEMNVNVYSLLLKALTMPNKGDTSCYPVRISAAGAIAGLLENNYCPPEWLPIIQVVIDRIGNDDDESVILFQLLCSIVEAGDKDLAVHIPFVISSLVTSVSKFINPSREPWSQVVVRGFEALAVIAKTWENLRSEEIDQKKLLGEMWVTGQATISKAFSALLQQAWLSSVCQLGREDELPPPSCIDHSSAMLRSIMQSVTESGAIIELKLCDLLEFWTKLIADWHAWEESEDMCIFYCIKEIVIFARKYGLKNFIVRQTPETPAPPVPERSMIEAIGAFVSEAISQYRSATWRACSCVHVLLHVPNYSSETEVVRRSLAVIFTKASYSCFIGVRSQPCSLWKSLLLAISSCYLCCSDIVEVVLEKEEEGGFKKWASALALAGTRSSEICLSAKSDLKLMVFPITHSSSITLIAKFHRTPVLTQAKVIERLLGLGNTSDHLLEDCFVSLVETSIRLKEVDEEMNNMDGEKEESETYDDDDDDEVEDDDEDSESDGEHEETEQEFLERYAEVANALENETAVEEGDVEDQDEEVELGTLEEVVVHEQIFILMKKYPRIFLQAQASQAELIIRFLDAFPECRSFFQHSA